MDLARFAIEKRLISTVSTLLILVAGYFAYVNLPRFEDPEFVIRHPIDICLDQVGINGKAMTTNQAFGNAARDGGFKYIARKIAIPELTMAIF